MEIRTIFNTDTTRTNKVDNFFSLATNQSTNVNELLFKANEIYLYDFSLLSKHYNLINFNIGLLFEDIESKANQHLTEVKMVLLEKSNKVLYLQKLVIQFESRLIFNGIELPTLPDWTFISERDSPIKFQGLIALIYYLEVLADKGNKGLNPYDDNDTGFGYEFILFIRKYVKLIELYKTYTPSVAKPKIDKLDRNNKIKKEYNDLKNDLKLSYDAKIGLLAKNYILSIYQIERILGLRQ